MGQGGEFFGLLLFSLGSGLILARTCFALLESAREATVLPTGRGRRLR